MKDEPVKDHDPVNSPRHYTAHPSGIECIDVTEHFSFNVGNAIKYLWRADFKGAPIEDLKKAAWYVAREIAKRERPQRVMDEILRMAPKADNRLRAADAGKDGT